MSGECVFAKFSAYHDAWNCVYEFKEGETAVTIWGDWNSKTSQEDRWEDAQRIYRCESPDHVLSGYHRRERRQGHAEGSGSVNLK